MNPASVAADLRCGKINLGAGFRDSHAESAAALFTLIASCRLHKLDPEQYLDELLRLLPYWPKDRYLELAPLYWLATRHKLNPVELEQPLAVFTVPPV